MWRGCEGHVVAFVEQILELNVQFNISRFNLGFEKNRKSLIVATI